MPNEGKEKIFYLIDFNCVCGFELFVNLADILRDREPYSREGGGGKMRKEKIQRPAITICSVLQGSWLHCERIKEEEEEGSNFLGLLFGPGLQNYQKG